MSKWTGEAEQRLKRAFSEARARAPSILFLDEFDALAMKRDSSEDAGARRVLSELLIQINAVCFDDGITVIAATNRLSDIDPAIVRRFQKVVEVGLPTREERQSILLRQLEPIDHQVSEEEIRYLSEATEGWSGSLLYVGIPSWWLRRTCVAKRVWFRFWKSPSRCSQWIRYQSRLL